MERCVYCGARTPSEARVCAAHRDLPVLEDAAANPPGGVFEHGRIGTAGDATYAAASFRNEPLVPLRPLGPSGLAVLE